MVKALKTRQILQELYQNEMLARFIIDEAHCVSAWGHDFRKDYASLQILKNEYPEVPIVALTATARKKVADDTVKILQIPNCRRFHTGKLHNSFMCRYAFNSIIQIKRFRSTKFIF